SADSTEKFPSSHWTMNLFSMAFPVHALESKAPFSGNTVFEVLLLLQAENTKVQATAKRIL
ncbi:MAG TPA: hypothetical protein VGE46_09305, partial [Bdellovibrio sp.]